MSATVEKAKANWTGYWNQPGVAESFGGKEELKQNPKYYLEEEPIASQIPKCDCILDAGCGVGRYTALVKDKCILYVGVDYSEKMLEHARKNNPFPNVAFVQGDLESIVFKKTLFDKQVAKEKFDVGLLIAIIRHLPYEKGLAVLRHVADACKTLFFTATIVPEEKQIPMIVKGIGDNVITDHPYHLSDIKKTLGVDTVYVVPIGDRDPTEGDRYLFRVGEPVEEPVSDVVKKDKPWNRMSSVKRKIHG